MPVIRYFPEVFPDELPRLPPPRQVEFQIDLVPGAAPVAKRAPIYGTALRREEYHIIDNKGVHVDPAKIEVIRNWVAPTTPTEVRQFLGLAGYYWRFIEDSYNQLEEKECLVDALKFVRRRIEPLGVQDLMMTVHNNLSKQILDVQKEAMKRKNVKVENLGRLIKQIFEFLPDEKRCFGNHVWLPRFGGLRDLIIHESHKSSQNAEWSEVGDSQLTGLELIRETTEKIVQIKNRLLTARSRQKSYADRRSKPLEFEVGDMVLLKILARVGPVAYTLELPEELKALHSMFPVSNLKKCLADENIIIPLDEIQLDDKLHFIEEPVEITPIHFEA
ncbi:hypothetical protein Tco_1113568 [Tanacetum coccineum]|uniref:Tf2-1-like SH3-like domain-containing protein n=1 Tax=Tanacetum coccineum TaxID=301880 RepID=A0ABQ5IU18_9ASTR